MHVFLNLDSISGQFLTWFDKLSFNILILIDSIKQSTLCIDQLIVYILNEISTLNVFDRIVS